jgi:hypothetical protein
MVCRSWPFGVVLFPLNRNWPNIWKTVKIPTPKPYIFLCQVADDSVKLNHTEWSCPSLIQEVPKYLKTCWDPYPPKPCIFLFLVSSRIWWYVGHDHMEWSCSSWYRKWSNILKTVEIPTPCIYSGASLIRTTSLSGRYFWEQTVWKSIKCDSFIRTLRLSGQFCLEPKCSD